MQQLTIGKYFFLFLIAGLVLTTGFRNINDPEPKMAEAELEATGVWISDNGNEKFEIYRRGEKFYGRIIWTNHEEVPGTELVDANNPNPEQRERPLVGLEILRDFVYKGNGVYGSGKVYDPTSGNTYRCRIKVDGDIAKVRGYVLMPLLGRTELAHRVTD